MVLAMEEAEIVDDGRHDFDFVFGQRRVHNRMLARRLDGCTDWFEFTALGQGWPVLGGLGNVDTFSGVLPDGRPVEGMAMRQFDPQSRLWTIWWVSSTQPGRMDPPVVGGFAAGHGRFFGEDEFDGRPIRVRFDWTGITATTARWEQAFSADGGATWESNWVMTFTRDT
jgi:hypothetical protein